MPAQLALDVTAPDESTLALLRDVLHPRLVAAAAAQQPASVQAEGRLVAYSASRAGDAEPGAGRRKQLLHGSVS